MTSEQGDERGLRGAKIYIAGAYEDRKRLQSIRALLQEWGALVTARWLDSVEERADEADAGIASRAALGNLEDIARAEVVLQVRSAHAGSGARHVEIGYALALGLPIVLWGAREHIFHHLSAVYPVEGDGPAAFVAVLEEVRRVLRDEDAPRATAAALARPREVPEFVAAKPRPARHDPPGGITIGRVVHYLRGGVDCAATITALLEDQPGVVHLTYFPPPFMSKVGLNAAQAARVPYAPTGYREEGTWHFPERVD